MCHIKTERDIAVEHILYALYHTLGGTSLVFAPPMIKPPTPKLAAHQRCVRTSLLKTFELLLNVGSRTKVDSPKQIVQTIPVESTAPITLEKGNLSKPGTFHDVTNRRDIRFINSIGTVFIFYLYHNDIPSPGNLQRCELLANFLHKNSCTLHEVRIECTENDIFLLQ